MATAIFATDLVGWRNRRGQFMHVSDAARSQVQIAGQRAMKQLKDIAVAESPLGKHPFGTPNGYKRFKDSWLTTFRQTPSGAELTLTNTSEHAGVVMFKTPEHEIHARNKRTLRFMGKSGDVVFRRMVNHPGTKGNDVLSRVREQSGPVLAGELNKLTAQIQTQIVQVFR